MTAGPAPMRHATRFDGWVVAAAMIIPSLVTWIYFVWLADESSGGQQSAYAVGKTIQFALPVVWVTGVQRGRLGLGPLNFRGWALGIAFGLLVVTSMMCLYYVWLKPYGEFDQAAEQILQKVRGFGVASPLSYAALATFYALVHSGLEEYYWRWFVFGQLRHLQPVSTAAILSSLGFMMHHVILLGIYFGWNSPLTYLFSFSVAVGGIFWAWLYHRAQSIYAPWISHMLVDAGIFLLGYDVIRGILA